MADNFFQEPTATTEEVVTDKIKLGEDEYTQEELQKLVGLGKIGLEAENKYKTRIDRVWPQFQTVISEKRELENKLKEAETKLSTPAPQPGVTGQLTAEQVRSEALRQAKELGLVTRDDFDKAVSEKTMQVIQGQQLINDISTVIDDMSADGLPKTTTEEVLAHMQETGIRNPEKAYKDMFEKEYMELQATKFNQIKSKGLPTVSASSAGSKQPAPIRVTKDNLEELVSDALKGSFE